MSVSFWQEPGAEKRPEYAEVAIIGAGLIGAYLALRLREKGRHVAIVESLHVAGGASGRNAGMVLSGIADNYYQAVERYGRSEARTLWAVTLRNRELMLGLAQRFGSPVGMGGSLVLAVDDQEARELREAAALLHEDGFSVEFHPTDPLRRGFCAAIHDPGNFVINPVHLVRSLIEAAGARLYEGSQVYALESSEDSVLIRARGLNLAAQQVILATNAFTPLIEPTFAQVIIPQRGQVLITAPNPPVLKLPCYANRGFDYFRQLSDGRFLMGGCRNRAFDEESTYADMATPRVQAALEAFLARYFPDVTAPVERRWSGTMGFTPDGLPLVGRLRRDERIAFAVGFNGHGLGLGLMAAEELLAELRGHEPGFFSARRLMNEAV